MEIKLDLHVHSACSPDGRMPVEQIVSLARARGLHGVAVCDHDHALEDIPQYEDFVVIPGVEVSTERGHLLGLFVSQQLAARSFVQAVQEIHAEGGLAVMAHPFARSRDMARLDDVLDDLDGIEIWNGRAERKNAQANVMAQRLAQRSGKLVTAGSDAHVPRELGNGVTVLEVPALTIPDIRTALLRGAVRVEGRRGRALDVAKSQWTKRRKTGAGIAAYAKWALFAGKCGAQDCITREDTWHVVDCKNR